MVKAGGVGRVVWYCGSSQGRGTRAAGWFEDYLNEKKDDSIKSYRLEEGIKGWVRQGKEYVEWMDGYDEGKWVGVLGTGCG